MNNSILISFHTLLTHKVQIICIKITKTYERVQCNYYRYFYIDTLNLEKKVGLHVFENSFVKTLVKVPLLKAFFNGCTCTSI